MASAGIFPKGAKPRTDKNDMFSARQRRERKFSRFFRRFRLNFRVFDASAEGASENFRVFFTGTAYDVIIFKFHGGGQLPQVAPTSGRLCVYELINIPHILTTSK